MKIGCVKEIKNNEYRVGLTPENVGEYITHGHQVMVEAGAGMGAGFADSDYEKTGAVVTETAGEIWAWSDMIIKVKEPVPVEYYLLHSGQIVFAYLHLAVQRMLAKRMLRSKCIGVAYETLTDSKGNLPLLLPMSEIAGRLSAIEGAKYMQKPFGGNGVLISGAPGVRRAKVVILGGGVVGSNAARMALGLGADVIIMDINAERLARLDELFCGKVGTVYSTPAAIENQVCSADLVIGAVLIPGSSAPKLISREIIQKMNPGTVFVDVAVDQGGCSETTHATTHDNPTYVVDGVLHYCVANMPGSVSYTSTMALTNATLPYGLKIADMGLEAAVRSDPGIGNAVNMYKGSCTYKAVADMLETDYTDIFELI